ncbi:MAG: altronate oxidoreductase [Deltaproteobacteria bacterium]|nr:altronate oxidoreductase [Deltaproteobacteria bacterium]
MENISQRITKPVYPVRIIQFGEGNFLRAFVDWMVDRMNEEMGFQTGITVIQPIAAGLTEKINAQNGIYTLFLNGLRDGKPYSEHRVIRCIDRCIDPYTNFQEYLRTAENRDSRFVVSNTTEAGIAFNGQDRMSDLPPSSFPAKLTVWLYRRYRYFHGSESAGLIFLPCELIENNGDNLKECILKYSNLWKLEKGFSEWLNKFCSFCNTLVDRITPGYPKERAPELITKLGYEDPLMTEAELFHLWVIQGPDSIREELPFHKCGLNVLFVKDVAPYRTRKVRILNGAHTSLVPAAYLMGMETVRESVEHPLLGTFLRKTLSEEIIPTLDLPKEELTAFADEVIERFKNPFIKHYLMSIALNSIPKFQVRVLPSLVEYMKRHGRVPERLALSFAALIAFYKGRRGNDPIPLNDSPENLTLFEALWASHDSSMESMQKMVMKILGQRNIWQTDLNEWKGLGNVVGDYLWQIETRGMDATLHQVCRNS